MRVVTAQDVAGKRVLLRLDFDVPIENGQIVEDFRLRAGLPTIRLCIENAKSVTLMGHIGRPKGEDSKLSVAPIVNWLEDEFPGVTLPEGKLSILENLRFEEGEDECSMDFAKELFGFGDVFVNEAFASHHKSASVTVLPTLLPHFAGLNFAKEVETIKSLRQNPQKPLVSIIGGAKLDDKLPVVETLAKVSDAVIVGGKLPYEIKVKNMNLPSNVLVSKMTTDGFDIDPQVLESYKEIIKNAKQVVWAGPVGFYEEGHVFGIQTLAQAAIDSSAHLVIGGGDTVTALNKAGFLQKIIDLGQERAFVSTGGGAMLKLLVDGTLPSIEALN